LTLLDRESRIARLGDGGTENVQHAGVLPLTGEAAEFFVHPLGVLPRQMRYASNAQQLEVALHGWSYGYQVAEAPFLEKHRFFSLTLIL
jgi:hypothetical protein